MMAIVLSVTAGSLFVWMSRSGPASDVHPAVSEESPATANLLVSAEGGAPVPGSKLAMHNSPSLATDPTNSRFVALANRLDGPDFSCSLQLSGDAGASWVPASPVPELPAGAEKCYAPEVAFDPDGRLYYLFVGLHTSGNRPMGAFITTSSDRGQTFTPPVQVLDREKYQVRMVIDRSTARRGRIHLVWLDVTGEAPIGGLPASTNPLVAAYSDDGGKNFSKPVQVSDPRRRRVVAPALALGKDRSVHVLYYDLEDDARDYHGLEGPAWEGHWSLVHSFSSDGGQSFRSQGVIDDAVVPPERVMLIYTMAPASLAADKAGRLYTAWHDRRNGDWDVLLRASSDAGRTWGSPTRLNDDPVGNGRHQYLPRLSVAPSGRVDAMFYDRRNDPENLYNDVYYTFSSDGGKHFAANQKLTSDFSDSRIGQRYPLRSARDLVEFGSRLGLFSSDDGALAAWTDTRNAVLEQQQDVFTARIVFPPSNRTFGGWAPFAIIGLLGCAATFLLVGMARKRFSMAPHERRTRHAVRQPTISLLCALCLAAACSPRDGAALPSTAPEAQLTMREYALDGSGHEVLGGRVVFRIRNAGRLEHQLTLLPIPDDLPGTITEQLRSPDRIATAPLTVLPARKPGETNLFAANLPAGRYGLMCFVRDADGQTHAAKGLNLELRVR